MNIVSENDRKADELAKKIIDSKKENNFFPDRFSTFLGIYYKLSNGKFENDNSPLIIFLR